MDTTHSGCIYHTGLSDLEPLELEGLHCNSDEGMESDSV
jgi:hypothetical protein